MKPDTATPPSATPPADNTYDASKIKVLDNMEAVRKRPGMYIGDTASYGLHHLVRELVDNSVDEHLATDTAHPNGFCQNVHVILYADGSVSVADDGRGIPVDIHAEQGVPALELALTKLHAGGKFDNTAYKVSGGLHGVGLSVVNALSEWLNIEVCTGGKRHTQRYARGEKVTELKTNGAADTTGTMVHFKPDPTIFTDTDFKYDIIAKRLRDLAFLNAGLSIRLEDQRTGKSNHFLSQGGVKEFVKFLNTNKGLMHDDILYLRALDESGKPDAEVAFQYNDGYNENVMAFANNIHTPDGGTHLVGFRTALTRAVNAFARKNNLLKNGDEPPGGDDLREGLSAIVSVKLREPQFEGQTKTKLGNSDVQKKVEIMVYEQLTDYLEEKPDTARAIFLKAQSAQQARLAAKKAKELARRKGILSSGALPAKLADCSSQNVAESELFVVEGDSAGGSAKQARDRRTQAILPLKGKILNVEKARLDKMLSHEEIQILITAVGTGIGAADFDYANLRYGKIILMTDADVDGSHIRTLLLTFFYRHLPELVTRGNIYIAQPPLYRVTRKKHQEYVHSDREMDATLLRLGLTGCRVRELQSQREFAGATLESLSELLSRLENFRPTIHHHGIPFEQYLTMRNSQGRLPRLLARQGRDESFYYTIEEFNQAVANYELTAGREIFVWESGEDATGLEAADFKLYHIPEAPEVEKLLSQLEALGLRVEDYAGDLQDRFELQLDSGPRRVSGIAHILPAIRKEGARDIEIQRYKGLGEMNPEQLWDTTMDPVRRTLLRVTLDDAAHADWLFNVLMGSMVEPRRDYIDKHALSVRNLDFV